MIFIVWIKKVIFIVWIKCFSFDKHFSCISGSKYLNLHGKLHFPVICSIQRFKFFCPSIPVIVHLQVTLKSVNFFYHILSFFFMVQLWKVILNPVNYFWLSHLASSKEKKTLYFVFLLHLVLFHFLSFFLAPNSKQAYETFIQYILKELLHGYYSDKSYSCLNINHSSSINLFINLLIYSLKPKKEKLLIFP